MKGDKAVKGFVWFKMPVRWADSITEMTDEQAGIILKAIYKYVVNGIAPVFQDEKTLSMFWVAVERWFANDAAMYNQLKNNHFTRR